NWVKSRYPEVAAEAENLKRDGWELQGSPQAEIRDFGTGSWNDRKLDTAIVGISLEMRNRALGRYRTLCKLVGYQDDGEFQMIRSVHATDCSEQGQQKTGDWLTGLLFTSKWSASGCPAQ
ncbi:MAG: hypothetical protein JO047_07755, partial [Alphaproteobacteria bacterium]|nr:hypothetical protein [Alphaproteobacteria bacterium]